jgi:predicted Holliday junction resolvase-like endonuclease
MKSWKPISVPCRSKRPSEISRLERCFVAVVLVLGASITTDAKDASLTAVVLFDGPQGAAYVQITEAALNGKIEVRSCDGVSRLDKNTYNGLPRMSLAGASSLQRGADGVLTLTANGKSICVVPSNLKFERSVELTPAEGADQAVIRGTPVSSSPRDAVIPEFKPGVKLVFIAAPDAELADFLRAQRANTIRDWEDFLTRYPSSARRASAQDTIAGFHQMAAETAFARYQSSSSTKTQDIAMLRQACLEAQTASQSSPGYKPAARLMDNIARELDNLAQPDQARLQAYRKALQDHTPGYSQLSAAKLHVERLLEVRPDYAPLLSLQLQLAAEQRKLETTIVKAQVLIAESHYDQAVNSLGPYVAFASEMPRLDAVLNAAFQYHYDNGQRLAAHQDWEKAIPEFGNAAAIRPDRKDVQAAAAVAAARIEAQRNQQAVNTAILESDEYARQNQFVEAYNVLADLPEKQRALVTAQLAALSHDYIGAAVQRAQKIQESHVPIKNPTDENAALEAYILWDRASSLGDSPAITLKRDFLSAKISAYYLDQANRYLQKASGSGAGVGWLYLKQAVRYGITNLDSLKDEMARYEPLYQRQSQLSVGIVFRDQTSRGDSHGFADQLADAITSGLDSSGMPIAVARNSSEVEEAQHPNFTLVGQVLEHRVVKNAHLEAPESKYREGARETKNPAWLQIESDYESAQRQLSSAQHALADTQAQHEKKQVIADATDSVQQAQKIVDELRHKLETTEQSRVETVVESYHYTKKTIDLTASAEIEFQFRDRAGNFIGQPVDVHKGQHTTTVVLQDVKAEDTEGITNQGVEPDGAQFLTDLEIDSRNALVKAVREKAAELPAAILQTAGILAKQGDQDGAAELYVLYLNATPQGASPGRDEAVKFLRDRFNLAVSADTKL